MQFRLGRIMGIPIEVDASWFIVFGLIVLVLALGHFPTMYPQFGAAASWVAGFTAALLLFASVLVHELAHSVVALREGMNVTGITLFIFGGVSKIDSEPKSAFDEFKMAAAGPLMSLVLGAMFWALGVVGNSLGLDRVALAVFGYLAVVNVILAVFNLIPGFPLDGGRVFRSVVWGATHNLSLSTRMAAYVGQGFGYVFVLFGVITIFSGNVISGIWLGFIGWFLANAARSSYEQMELREALTGIHVDRVMNPNMPAVSPHSTVQEFVENYLYQQDDGAFPVVEDGELRGIVSLEDVRLVPKQYWPQTSIAGVARPADQEATIADAEDAWEAFRRMASSGLRRLLVMRDGKPVGMVTMDSLLNLARTRIQLRMNQNMGWRNG